MKKFIIFIMVLFITTCITACTKLSMDNYQLLKVGMSYQDVTQIIGEPLRCEEALGTRHCQWGEETPTIKVTFLAEKAVLFSHQGLK